MRSIKKAWKIIPYKQTFINKKKKNKKKKKKKESVVRTNEKLLG